MKSKNTRIALGILISCWVFTAWKPDWGFFAHKRINRLAVFTLVPDMMPLFKTNIEFITAHAVDADKRRYAVSDEAIRHYIDLDLWPRVPQDYLEALILYGDLAVESAGGNLQSIFGEGRIVREQKKQWIRIGTDPGNRVEWNAFRRFLKEELKVDQRGQDLPVLTSDSFNHYFGQTLLAGGQPLFWIDTFSRHGILPYHIQSVYQRLVNAFKAGEAPVILRLATDLGHYVADAHVPLHTTSNYNGQKTGQTGLHAFWESRIPELFADESYDYLVGKARYIRDVGKFSWDMIHQSHQLVDSVLGVEKRLSRTFPPDEQYCFDQRAGLTVRTQCPAYAGAYQSAMKGMVENRMRDAILALGSLWYSAWVDAGQPVLSGRKDPVSENHPEDSTLEKAYRERKILGRPED
jgi:hypothetical protein